MRPALFDKCFLVSSVDLLPFLATHASNGSFMLIVHAPTSPCFSASFSKSGYVSALSSRTVYAVIVSLYQDQAFQPLYRCSENLVLYASIRPSSMFYRICLHPRKQPPRSPS